jgi:hypothetical protein
MFSQLTAEVSNAIVDNALGDYLSSSDIPQTRSTKPKSSQRQTDSPDRSELDASKQRKEDIRHKIIVGACLLADMEKRPDLAGLLEASLKRCATPRDVEFLRTKGWKL